MSRPALIVVSAFVILPGLLLLLFNGAQDEAGVAETRLVDVKAIHQACKSDADCVIIYIDCSGCGCGVPVNREYEVFYRARYGDLCMDYSGPVCEVYCPDASSANPGVACPASRAARRGYDFMRMEDSLSWIVVAALIFPLAATAIDEHADECASPSNPFEQVSCYAAAARTGNKLSACDRAGHEGVRYQCYEIFAEHTVSAPVCHRIPATTVEHRSLIDLCLSDVAVKSRDPGLKSTCNGEPVIVR